MGGGPLGAAQHEERVKASEGPARQRREAAIEAKRNKMLQILLDIDSDEFLNCMDEVVSLYGEVRRPTREHACSPMQMHGTCMGRRMPRRCWVQSRSCLPVLCLCGPLWVVCPRWRRGVGAAVGGGGWSCHLQGWRANDFRFRGKLDWRYYRRTKVSELSAEEKIVQAVAIRCACAV